jgi:D-alanine-D-alanine ligase
MMTNGRHVIDPADFGTVAVVMGGASAEREISLLSGRAVLAALKRRGVDTVGIDVDERPLGALQAGRFDRVFNIVHGRGGEDGVLQGVLEALGVPYTGSRVLGSALSMDKLRTKMCWQSAGIPTPAWRVLRSDQDLPSCAAALGFPVIVKPALEGSSIGISRANSLAELKTARRDAARYRCDVFAEAWVSGKEYTVAILDEEPLPMIRLETPNIFYDYDAKYCADTTQYHCPCGLSDALEKQLQELALNAYRTLDANGWGRVDLFLDAEQQPWLIEVNTVPGMTDHSLVPMAANAAGIDFDELVWRILETSFGNKDPEAGIGDQDR